MKDDYVLVFVGNEFERKGLPIVLHALKILGDVSVKLVVVGDGNRKPYGNLASNLGILDQVHFVGSTNQPEDFLVASDAFIFPSLYEPFGIAIVEAMAAGIPVITSRACGAVEKMKHLEHYVALEDPTSVEELVAAVRRVRGDRSLAHRLSTNGIRAAEEYSWGYIAEMFLKEYRSVFQE